MSTKNNFLGHMYKLTSLVSSAAGSLTHPPPHALVQRDHKVGAFEDLLPPAFSSA